MSWENIIRKSNDFQFFLHEVFNVPPIYSKGLKPSKGLIQSIKNGTIADKITEEYFDIISAFIEIKLKFGRSLERLVWSLEQLIEGYPLYLTDYRE